MAGSYVGYAVMWVSSVFYPFLMAWGLARKSYLIVSFGALGQAFIYTLTGLKGNLVFIAIIIGFSVLLKANRRLFGVNLVWGLVLLGIVLNSITITMTEDVSDLPFAASNILFMRSIGMPGLLTAEYADFFSDHPLTYLSHVKGINLFIKYPYRMDLGYEVGSFHHHAFELNSNAHFWAMDGLAGLGLPGIVLLSLLCGGVLFLIDSVASRHDIHFSALFMTFTAINLSNVSLFTSLLSGGVFLSWLMFWVMPDNYTAAAVQTRRARELWLGFSPSQNPLPYSDPPS
jgi:hypothetical protein